MSVSLPEIISNSEKLAAADFLSDLVRDKFPKKVLVTASLRARSIVTLQMIADVAPSTPVVFCHVKNVFPESLEYRAEIIEKLGLTDVREPQQDAGALPGDSYHSEALWADDPVGGTRSYTTIPLNQTLQGFDCWISAVFHNPYTYTPRPPMMEEGRLIRIAPLAGWSKEDVHAFLNKRGLPFHPKAMEQMHQPFVPRPVVPGDDYHY